MTKGNIKIAIILSGCGFKDGAEIQEATMSMLAVKQAGAQYQCFAPDIEQHHVTNHLTGETLEEKRNVLVESARIARGDIKPLSELKVDDYDGLLLPGGFGAALNLSTFALDGANCSVNSDVENAVKSMHQARKPIGALCISPVILGKIFDHVKVTVGADEGVNQALHEMGAETQNTTFNEIVADHVNKVVTGPCYMLDSNIVQIAQGAQNVVNQMIEWIG